MKKLALLFTLFALVSCFFVIGVSASSFQETISNAFESNGYAFGASEGIVQLACGYELTDANQKLLESNNIKYGIFAAAKSKVGSDKPLLTVNGSVEELNGYVTLIDASNFGIIDAKIIYKDDSRYSTYIYFGLYATDGTDIMYLYNDTWSESPTAIRYKDIAQDKFSVCFANTDKYLYRVGNGNPVSLSSLFSALENASIDSSSVVLNVESKNGVKGIYTPNTSDWTKGTIQFSGTGVVTVTISCDDGTPVSLNLEVVDAKNVTTYNELENRNSVLLNDITMSNGGTYYLSGATLYGNGFTFDMTYGAYAAGGNVSSNYVFGLKNATIDNVKIVGAVYTQYGATVSSDYNRAAVLTTGNCTITNSYISNCASPVRVKDGNLEIVNSTLKGGNFANLDIRGGHIVLDNVTTINQVNGNDTAADDTVVVGLGIVVFYENVQNTTTIEIKNGITQYNYLSKTQAETYIKDTTAKQLVSVMFNSNYSAVQYNDGSDTWINTGILSMTETVGNENISDVEGYIDASPSMLSTTGYLHTKKPDATSINAVAPTYETAGQGPIAPSYSFDYTSKNYVAKADGSNDYCYEEEGTVFISMDEGDVFNWDSSILTVTKNGQALSYTVSMNGIDYTGKSISFNTTGKYTVEYTYIDSSNYCMDNNGNLTTYAQTYVKIVHINVSAVKPDAKHAEFTFGSSNTSSTTITIGNNTYVMPNVSGTSSTIGSTTVDGKTIYYPIVEIIMSDGKTSHNSAWYAYFPVFSGAVTIIDYKDSGTGDQETFGASTTSLPTNLSVVGDPAQLFKYQSGSTAGTTPVVKNNILVYSSPSISAKRSEYNTVIQYSYQDNAGTTYYYYIGYHAPAQSYSSICVTPDTLVTMADGTQKEIQYTSVGDMVIAWNFHTGKYEIVPLALSQIDGEGEMDVLHLYFDNGTELKVLGEHGIFDADLNNFIFIDKDDVEQYIGHSFIAKDDDSFATTKLIGYSITKESTKAYTVLSATHHNVILEGLFTVSPAHVGDNFFNPFEIDDNMMYDEKAVQADIEKYGLYTYEDFAEVLTYEQFVALNLAQFKVSVGKGLVTYDGLIYLIKNFINR